MKSRNNDSTRVREAANTDREDESANLATQKIGFAFSSFRSVFAGACSAGPGTSNPLCLCASVATYVSYFAAAVAPASSARAAVRMFFIP